MFKFFATLSLASLPFFLSAFSVLSEGQVAQYHKEGFLVIPNFIEESDCDELKAHVETMLDAFEVEDAPTIFQTTDQVKVANRYFLESGDKIRYFFEKDAFEVDGTLKQAKEKSINKIGHAMHDLDPVFNKFCRNKKLADLSKDIGFKNPLLVQSMYIFKQPFIGGEVNCHQDSSFLYSVPDTTVGYWIAIEDATLENGCLWAIPEEQTVDLKTRFERNGQDQTQLIILDSTPWDLEKMKPLEVKKGSLIILHGHAPHMSYANTSPISRHAFTLHIIESTSTLPTTNWLRRDESLPFKGF